MNEETKLPTTRDSETAEDKGRCAPASGSAVFDIETVEAALKRTKATACAMKEPDCSDVLAAEVLKLRRELNECREKNLWLVNQNLKLENNLRARAAELDGADKSAAHLKCRIRKLEEALRDAISTYGPSPVVVVTEERQEAWMAVLTDPPNAQAH